MIYELPVYCLSPLKRRLRGTEDVVFQFCLLFHPLQVKQSLARSRYSIASSLKEQTNGQTSAIVRLPTSRSALCLCDSVTTGEQRPACQEGALLSSRLAPSGPESAGGLGHDRAVAARPALLLHRLRPPARSWELMGVPRSRHSHRTFWFEPLGQSLCLCSGWPAVGIKADRFRVSHVR